MEREKLPILISLLYNLPSPSHFTLLSSLQSPQWEPDMHYHCVSTAYCLAPVPLCTMLNWGTGKPTILNFSVHYLGEKDQETQSYQV